MKALSLTQPWATLCVCDAPAPKEFETRSWATMYRGPLLIHAAKGYPDRGLRFEEPFMTALWQAGIKPDMPLPTGAIVGAVVLRAIFRIHEDCLEDVLTHAIWPLPSEPEHSFGDYTPGRFAWHFEDPRLATTPIPTSGALSLWTYGGPLPKELTYST